MSLPPEYVPQIQELLGHLRAAARIGEAMLREIRETRDEVCRTCEGSGVFGIANTPCDCPKGATFRAAAAMQRAKAVGRERAAGERDE